MHKLHIVYQMEGESKVEKKKGPSSPKGKPAVRRAFVDNTYVDKLT